MIPMSCRGVALILLFSALIKLYVPLCLLKNLKVIYLATTINIADTLCHEFMFPFHACVFCLLVFSKRRDTTSSWVTYRIKTALIRVKVECRILNDLLLKYSSIESSSSTAKHVVLQFYILTIEVKHTAKVISHGHLVITEFKFTQFYKDNQRPLSKQIYSLWNNCLFLDLMLPL